MHAYLNYLKEALGLESFILPERSSEPTVLPTSQSPLAFFIPSVSKRQLSSEAHGLLQKMTQAMGFSLEDIFLSVLPPEEWDFSSAPSSVKVIVTFTSDETAKDVGVWKELNGLKILSTYSPELLIHKPEFKKPTWAHLQSVMSALK